MRLTYTDLWSIFRDGTQNSGSSDSSLEAQFQRFLDRRYQTALAVLSNYQTRKSLTASTVADQQNYHNPPGMSRIETATVTIGTIPYPLQVIHSQDMWNWLNEAIISTSAIPRFIFPQRDQFGIYPTPQGVYTITLNFDLRDRKLTTADYTTGTIAVTNNDETVTGSGTTFTSGMVNRWIEINGYWYRIASFTDTTHLELETKFSASTVSGVTYKIGESPELPEEGHEYLAIGAMADWFGQVRGDLQKSKWFNNVYWTGDGAEDRREGMPFAAGVLGVRDRYSGRSDSALVRRKHKGYSDDSQWVETISS